MYYGFTYNNLPASQPYFFKKNHQFFLVCTTMLFQQMYVHNAIIASWLYIMMTLAELNKTIKLYIMVDPINVSFIIKANRRGDIIQYIYLPTLIEKITFSIKFKYLILDALYMCKKKLRFRSTLLIIVLYIYFLRSRTAAIYNNNNHNICLSVGLRSRRCTFIHII